MVQPSALARAVGVILSGIAGFLSNLFLILMIMLFLLAEGPAMMDRLRASAGTDHPRIERLTFVGQSVVRQFGLRAVINVVTAAGITVLLFLLGVDFPLMWGILTFVHYIGLVAVVIVILLLVSIPLLLFYRDVRRTLIRFDMLGAIPAISQADATYLKAAEEVFASDPETYIFIYGHTHNASLKRLGERVVINTGTWLKKLQRVPARFRLLPSVYYPSFRLNYFRISEDEGRIAIDYERIQKAPPRELSLLQRLVARSPKRDALEDIPKKTVVDV